MVAASGHNEHLVCLLCPEYACIVEEWEVVM